MKIKKILVSQPKPAELEKSPYGEIAIKYGLQIDFHKFIIIEGVPAREFRKERINIQNHSAIILTSRNAVDHFFRMAREMRYEVPDSLKYFCISESTAYYLQKYVQFRKRKIFHGRQNFSELMELISKHKNEKFLLPCSDIHKQSMFHMLNEGEITYDKAVLYKTVASDLSHVPVNDYDMIVFFSPSGVRSLIKNFPDYKQENTLISAFGPTTSKAVVDAGLRLDIKAPTKTSPSMIMAIEEYLQSKKVKVR